MSIHKASLALSVSLLALASACSSDGTEPGPGAGGGAPTGAGGSGGVPSNGGAGGGGAMAGAGGHGQGGQGGCGAEIAAHHWMSCVRKTDGTLWCWGGATAAPTPSDLGSEVAEAGVGGAHRCARKTDATLWCWGANGAGQLGNGTTMDSSAPVFVSALGSEVAGVALGNGHSCARKADGTLWCWGDNALGQLGDGTTTASSTPIFVSALGSGVAEIDLGGEHSCARKTDGTLWCWGTNYAGQLGDGTTVDSSTPVPVTALGSDVAEVALGSSYTCARKNDGTLWCFGHNAIGQLGNGTTMDSSTPVFVSALGSEAAGVALGNGHSCARKNDGTLWCWGLNTGGQLGSPVTPTTKIVPTPALVRGLGSDVQEAALGGEHSCALKTDGTIWCWGSNAYDQLGGATTIQYSESPLQLGLCP